MIDIEQTGRDAVSREFWRANAKNPWKEQPFEGEFTATLDAKGRAEVVRTAETPGVGYLEGRR